jgi:hypothetical protein
MDKKKTSNQQVLESWSTPEIEVISIESQTKGGIGASMDHQDDTLS